MITFAAAITAGPAYCASLSFPAPGTDARSLGRGGTALATTGGASSVLGNPATLRHYGTFYVGGDFIRDRSAADGTFQYSVVDTKSKVRGALIYIGEPAFAGFENNLWGVAFAQSAGSTFVLGESFHSGDHINGTSGKTEAVSGLDLGFTLIPVPKLTLGYLARNVYRSDAVLSGRSSAYGITMKLPWGVSFAADLDETTNLTYPGERETRAGLVFSPLNALVLRAGYQDLAGNQTRYAFGLTYRDMNGTIDAAMLWDPDLDVMKRLVFALSIGFQHVQENVPQ